MQARSCFVQRLTNFLDTITLVIGHKNGDVDIAILPVLTPRKAAISPGRYDAVHHEYVSQSIEDGVVSGAFRCE